MNYIWIVEMKNGDRWEPTTGAGLTREDARQEKKRWEERSPSDKFRVSKYTDNCIGRTYRRE